MLPLSVGSPYVPHNLKQPLNGKESGLLSGLTVAVKDMYGIAGERVGGGSPAWLASQEPATAHSAVVERILAAGGKIVNKTICDEFFYSVTGENHHYGTPMNPRAPGRIPGGSSSGSASACSSGACDLAIGSDTGGSVRVPAALCGVYGIRVTHGRVDLRGAMPMAPSFDASGWFATSPGIFALAGKVLLNNWHEQDIDGCQFAAVTDAFDIVDPKIASVCNLYLSALVDRIPHISQVNVAGDQIDIWRESMRLVQAYEVWSTFGEFITNSGPVLGPGVAQRMEFAASVTQSQVTSSRHILGQVTKRMDQVTEGRTVLVLPTCPSIAPHIGSSTEELDEYRIRVMRMVCLCSISGLPQVTIPIGTADGAPVGLSLIGWRNGDEVLLKLAQAMGSGERFAV